MQSSTESKSLLARLSEQMAALEKRDWELWMATAGTGILAGIAILALLFQPAFLTHGALRLHIEVSPTLFFGIVALLVLFNTYVINRRVQLRRMREQIVSTTIQGELIRLQSFTDPLTEVYNRRALEQMAQRYISHAKRLKKPVSFMMVDIDRFKDVNSRFGHLTGDLVLAEVAAIIKGAVRGSDVVVRYGGDEFLVILADASREGAQTVVDRLRTHLGEWNTEAHLKNFELAFSTGLAEWAEGKTLDQMLDEADRKMYSVKTAQRSAAN